jgi:hypothetical protein
VAANVVAHACGALNIGRTRIAFTDAPDMGRRQPHFDGMGYQGTKSPTDGIEIYKEGGRWPANVILTRASVSALDEQSGDRSSPWIGNANVGRKGGRMFGGSAQTATTKPEYRDAGGAARFFKQVGP